MKKVIEKQRRLFARLMQNRALVRRSKRFASAVLVCALAAAGVQIAAAENSHKDVLAHATASTAQRTVADALDDAESTGQAEVVEAVEAVMPSLFTGFRNEEDGVHYYDKGQPAVSTFVSLFERLYRFDENGVMMTGWFQDADGSWYYFGTDGRSREGWIQDSGTWYYLDDRAYTTGWLEITDGAGNSGWYYFDENGAMLADTRTPDGWYVGADGICDESRGRAYAGEGFTWNKDRSGGASQISGLQIAGMPAEFYMLSVAGETGGMTDAQALVNGDAGRAYGICQFDYRYDLVGFMRYAYQKHPALWTGFAAYQNAANGDASLRSSADIGRAFLAAMDTDYETCITDQLEYLRMQYWDGFKQKLNAAGFNLDNRSVAVSAAMFSVNVNCSAKADIFISSLSPDMDDEALIRGTYRIRNEILSSQRVGGAAKGTNGRYLRAEPQMALDLLYGYITIDSSVNYGNGVVWNGNPFTSLVTTVPTSIRVLYAEMESAQAEEKAAEAESEAASENAVETDGAAGTDTETENDDTQNTQTEAETGGQDGETAPQTEPDDAAAGPGQSDGETRQSATPSSALLQY